MEKHFLTVGKWLIFRVIATVLVLSEARAQMIK